MTTPDIRTLWATAKAVCFDVDSTVSPDEGIDLLAAQAGVADEVKKLTKKTMDGNVPFEDALKARLALIKPSLSMIRACLKAHPPRLTPGIGELIAQLERRGTHVYLVSGGFIQMINPVANLLGLPKGRVYANDLRFAPDGSYTGIDEKAYTARSGGKAAALTYLKTKFRYDPIIMVGDGATDLEARPPADGFIGYGGVITRKVVKEKADWFVTDFNELIKGLILPVARKRSTFQ
jgi:phosphoserine phosphatase